MPAGCDLICKNDFCDHVGKFIAITSPWPMGKIQEVIASLSLEENSLLIYNLEVKQNEGCQYACITLPNDKDIEVLAYRINYWHPKELMVCDYHLELKGRSLEEALKDPSIPTKCPESKVDLISFEELLDVDIHCPFCNENMKKVRWFINE